MPQFTYNQQLTMPVRTGRKYSTVYYQLSPRQRQLLWAHVNQVTERFLTAAEANPDNLATASEPLREFPRRETPGWYSAQDIVTDLWHQLHQGRDSTAGMIGRWNRLFADTAHEIIMQPRSPGW